MIDAPRVLRALFAGAVTTIVLASVAAFGLGRFFLAVNVAYCAVMIAAPACGLLLFVLALRRGATRTARAIAAASLALVPIGIYATFVEPYDLRTETASIPLPARARERTPITIAVLADIQCVEGHDHERDAIARVMAAKPDLILLPGDLVQVGEHRLPEILDDFHALLAPLSAPLGVYFVQGNCETKEDARRLLAGTPVRFLDNEVVELASRDVDA